MRPAATHTCRYWYFRGVILELASLGDPRGFSGDLEASDTVTRQRDGRTWTFQSGGTDGYFGIDRQGFGLPLCLIFKPNDLGLVLNGDSYRVQVSGLRDGNGDPINLGYRTAFYSPELGSPSLPESDRPPGVTMHVDWQSQGSAVARAG